MGAEVLEVFADIAEAVASPSELRPEDTLPIRETIVERYLSRNHPRWIARTSRRRASGRRACRKVAPTDWPFRSAARRRSRARRRRRSADSRRHPDARPQRALRRTRGDDLVRCHRRGSRRRDRHRQGQRPAAHAARLGRRDERHVRRTPQRRPALGSAAERLQTGRRAQPRDLEGLPAASQLAPHHARRGARLAAQRNVATYILKGEALAITHEVNPDKPVSDTIVAHHNRTVAEVSPPSWASSWPRPRTSTTTSCASRWS